MCTLVGLNRSSYYHVAQDHSDNDVLESDLRKAAGNRPSDGYRRLTQTLRRCYKRYKTLNTKRVRRVMKRAGLNIQRRKKPRRTTNSQHGFQRYPNLVKDLKIDHPNQVWVGDMAAILLADGSEVFLAILMDVFTRKVVGWAARVARHHPSVTAVCTQACFAPWSPNHSSLRSGTVTVTSVDQITDNKWLDENCYARYIVAQTVGVQASPTRPWSKRLIAELGSPQSGRVNGRRGGGWLCSHPLCAR